MDWLIYHLIGDVLHHYWYVVQCKLYGYIKNKNVERVVASAVLRARDILDQFVKMYLGGQDIAQVMSVNHYPRVYTILAPDQDYA
jgi:benzoyl-CoA reductase/2-hydroxyglutaryl-CoA dehydratase subunit BcrC/BadD/HgdB